MPFIYVPYISGQYSGVYNDLLLTNDKHRVVRNGSFNKFGKWETRVGSTILNDLGTGNVLGVHDASFSDGTHKHLATVGDTIYNAQTGIAFSSHAFTSGAKMEFVNFLNLTFVVNGIDAMATLNSSGTYSIAANVSGAPTADYIVKYGSRVWANDTNNRRRVYRSDAVSSGTITWTTATEFFEVEGAGERVTGLHIARNTLMAFTNQDIDIRYFTRAKLGILTGVGTLSHRSIITKKGATYWHHHDTDKGFAGIYIYNGTGSDDAQLISTPIQDVFDNMTDAQADDIVAWEEGATLVWYLGGDVTMDYGKVNAVALNLKNNGWSTWYFPFTITAAGIFLNSTTLTVDSYVGDSNAIVFKRTGVQDNSLDIESFIESAPLHTEDPFVHNQFDSVMVKGTQFGSSIIEYKSNRDTQFIEASLQPYYTGTDMCDARLGTSGNNLILRITLNDQVGQSISGYRVEVNESGNEE